MDRTSLLQALEGTTYDTDSLVRIDEGQMGDIFANNEYVFKGRESINEKGMQFRDQLTNTPAVDAVFESTDHYIIVEERISPVQAIAATDFHALGELLAQLHATGRRFETGDRLPKYEYQDRFESWQSIQDQTEGWKRQRADEARAKREQIYEQTDRLESLDFEAEPVFFQHRDVILENIIKRQDQFFITDFEFAALGYRGIELFRFVLNGIIEYDTTIIEPLLTGYTDADSSIQSLQNGLGICLNYFLFNTFPFYLDTDRATIEQLADQRDQYLDTLVEQLPVIEEHIRAVCQS